MQIATLSQLKKEMEKLPPAELVALCQRLAKYKKENKELLHYLLLEADDEEGYKDQVKQDIVEEFKIINSSSLYYAKKSIRRILRMVNKHIKYSGNKQTQVELLLFFCEELRDSGIPFHDSKVLINLYNRQVQLIEKALSTLHEDLQFDYEEELEEARAAVI